jgi:hypothetical protein
VRKKKTDAVVDDQALLRRADRRGPSLVFLPSFVFVPGLVPLVLAPVAFSFALALAPAPLALLGRAAVVVVPTATGAVVVGTCSILVPATRALGWPTRKFWSELGES